MLLVVVHMYHMVKGVNDNTSLTNQGCIWNRIPRDKRCLNSQYSVLLMRFWNIYWTFYYPMRPQERIC